jgi:ABC-2 type transport system ATP-binding protein
LCEPVRSYRPVSRVPHDRLLTSRRARSTWRRPATARFEIRDGATPGALPSSRTPDYGRGVGIGGIEAESIERHFRDVQAVRGVSVSVAPGEIYGFLGPNGAGKSTFVKTLCTLLRPTGGRATVAGYDVVRDARAVRLSIGVALQEAALDDKQTGRELLRLQARLLGLRRREIDRRLVEVLQLVDIGSAIDRLIGTYSGGMRRRLDLAAALMHNPSVLFLDEPTTGLDPQSRVAVWQEVRRLNEELGMTIFLTTQYLEEADELAGRVGIISEGRLLREGTPAELKHLAADDVIEVVLDSTDGAILARIEYMPGVRSLVYDAPMLRIRCEGGAQLVSPLALALADAGVNVHSVTLREPTLDDAFLELTGQHAEHAELALVRERRL